MSTAVVTALAHRGERAEDSRATARADQD